MAQPEFLRELRGLSFANFAFKGSSLGKVRISDHGYVELAKDGILAQDVLVGLDAAIVVEDYAGLDRGPSVLTFQTRTAARSRRPGNSEEQG